MTRSSTSAERIDLYALCLNEAQLIPYFFGHYGPIVDRFYILDNGSTDGSQQRLAGDPRVEVRPFETTGDSFVDLARNLLDNVWKESRGAADWVAVVELDEHLHHADLRAYLAHLRQHAVSAVRSIGYQMVADEFPTDPRPLWQHLVRGARDTAYDKLALFRPDAVHETNYAVGRHSAQPTGTVVYEPHPQVKLLHYKNLGIDYVYERNTMLAGGLRERDRSEQWGFHYQRDRATVETLAADLAVWARRVPGLPPLRQFDLTLDDELLTLRESGLFDATQYAASDPGIADCGLDLLLHFCIYGWREGRRPNRHFDPAWYRARYARDISPEANPLLDYVLDGERAGRCPVPYFDPALYRHAAGLSASASPLRQFLSAEMSRCSAIDLTNRAAPRP